MPRPLLDASLRVTRPLASSCHQGSGRGRSRIRSGQGDGSTPAVKGHRSPTDLGQPGWRAALQSSCDTRSVPARRHRTTGRHGGTRGGADSRQQCGRAPTDARGFVQDMGGKPQGLSPVVASDTALTSRRDRGHDGLVDVGPPRRTTQARRAREQRVRTCRLATAARARVGHGRRPLKRRSVRPFGACANRRVA